MHLQINEQRYNASLLNNHIEIDYTSRPQTISEDSLSIKVEQYVCLFDNNWNVVDEVFSFLEHRLHIKRLSFNTIIAKGTDLKIFYDFLDEFSLGYKQVSESQINDFIAWLLSSDNNDTSKRTAKSINRIISTVKDFYTYHSIKNHLKNPFLYERELINRPNKKQKNFYRHIQNGLIEKNIFKIKEFDKGIRILTKEQITTILEACSNPRDRLLFELLLFTGMRIGEALSLDIYSIGVTNIREEIQSLALKSNENDYIKGNQHREQKTGPRELFIPSSLMQKLSTYYQTNWLKIYEKKEMQHDFFFISEFHANLGEPLSYQAVWNRCRKIGKICGIYFTPHDFRHTFATILARNSVGIERLKVLLGHRDIASTDVYIQIANKEEIMKDLIPFYENYGI